ncbi:hypothetical protein GF406_01110 [candidate division KSB1 bacterium]|nr:hypothetical protein [candidate division KSB1 bacterium]
MIVENDAQQRLMTITETGQVGIGTLPGIAPLGKLEVRTGDLTRIYENEGSLYLARGLRDQSYKSSIGHYTQVNGADWDPNTQMYWSTFVTPGAVSHIYNRSFISGPAGSNTTHWQINSGVYLPKHMVVLVNDHTVHFYQPHVSASNELPGPLRFGVDLDNGNMSISGQAYKPGGGDWQASSDARLKDVRGSYDRGLDDVLQLNPVRFNYKKNNARHHDHDIEYVGFIAQEVQKIFPEAVSAGKDGYLNFDMHVVNVALLNAIKEQQTQIQDLKAENARLSAMFSELADLEARVENLKSELDKSLNKLPGFSRAVLELE